MEDFAAWLDRLTFPLFPRWTLQRQRARVASAYLARHYDAAGAGRRTQGWRRTGGDANAANSSALGVLRNTARDVIRNNPYAVAGLDTITDHVVGWGIVGAPTRGTPGAAAVKARWDAWADTAACDADRRLTFAGLQKQVLRTVAESGEVLVRRRIRRPEDNLPIPMQLQVLEPDYLDVTKDGLRTPTGGWILQGIEFNPIGERIAYWLYRTHPGSTLIGEPLGVSDRIPASEIAHVWRAARPGQVRGVSWFAPVLLRLKDLDDYEDASLMKAKVAACLAVVLTDADGTAAPVGRSSAPEDTIDTLEPGSILHAPAGRTVSVVNPPDVSEHDAFTKTNLRAVATALGLTYEDLTGDYANMPFSAARMSRLRHWARVEDWRWNMLIPQFCDVAWRWAMQAAAVSDPRIAATTPVTWTAPAMPMVEPDKEGLAYSRNIRAGIMTLSEVLKERGYDPIETLDEMARDWREVDKRDLVLDSDARKMSQNGVRAVAELGTQSERIKDADLLIRMGFEPDAVLAALDLPPLPQTEPLQAPAAPPMAAPAMAGNGNGTGATPAA